MAGRTGDTFKKRQKEVARAEKAKEKIARRMERKLQKRAPNGDDSSIVDSGADVSDSDMENVSQSRESGAP